MINKIIASLIFICMLFAIGLSLYGVHYVELGKPFIAFLRQCSYDLNELNFRIPNIPEINGHWYDDWEIFGGNDDITEGIRIFLNVVINVLNFIVMAINTLLDLLIFVFIILRNFITMRDSLIENSSSVVQQLLIV